MSDLQKGNQALRDKRYPAAMGHYLNAWRQAAPASAPLLDIIGKNIRLAGKRYRAERTAATPMRVAVSGSSLSHNAVGRAYTLAQLYATFCEAEIIGPIFASDSHGKDGKIWEPIRNTTLPIHSLVVDDHTLFLDQALQLVAAHPYDLIHLSKPRIANIFIGLLYKLMWDARVLMDIDDEELAFVNATTPITLDAFLREYHQAPTLQQLTGKLWTRLAVGLSHACDGITVSNPALQQRYGGTIIHHARDEQHFAPSAARKRQSRERYGIPQDKQVALFFGTPRKHKGLLETARALASLARPELLFLVVGSFPNPEMRQELQAIRNLDIRFLENQPFDAVPDVMATGDICVLLQDPASPVSQFQVPAKLSDALGMGLTVLAQPTPAMADLEAEGAYIPFTPETLAAELRRVLEARPDTVNARALFQQHLSFVANIPKLQKVLQDSQTNQKSLDSLYPLVQKLEVLAPLRSLVMPGQAAISATGLQSWATDHGVSVIILTHNAAQHLDNCLSSFFRTNTHQPVELIVIDHASTDNTAETVANYKNKGTIQYIQRDKNYTFSESCNLGVEKAKYSYLLFLNNDIVYVSNILPEAVLALADPQVGAVGVRLDDDPASLPQGDDPAVQHTGIQFVWNEKRGYHQPEQIRHPSLKQYLREHENSPLITSHASLLPAVTGALMLVRKADFEKLNGFSEEYEYGLEDIDFCLRLCRDLKKHCCCINDVGLPHVEGRPALKGGRRSGGK